MWHHTGAVGNETNFYDLNDSELTDPYVDRCGESRDWNNKICPPPSS